MHYSQWSIGVHSHYCGIVYLPLILGIFCFMCFRAQLLHSYVCNCYIFKFIESFLCWFKSVIKPLEIKILNFSSIFKYQNVYFFSFLKYNFSLFIDIFYMMRYCHHNFLYFFRCDSFCSLNIFLFAALMPSLQIQYLVPLKGSFCCLIFSSIWVIVFCVLQFLKT